MSKPKETEGEDKDEETNLIMTKQIKEVNDTLDDCDITKLRRVVKALPPLLYEVAESMLGYWCNANEEACNRENVDYPPKLGDILSCMTKEQRLKFFCGVQRLDCWLLRKMVALTSAELKANIEENDEMSKVD